MRRFLVTLVGLGAMGAGARLLIEQTTHEAACNSAASHSARLSPLCQHAVNSYLGGFGIIGAGFITLVFSATIMKKKNMRRHGPKQPIKLKSMPAAFEHPIRRHPNK